MKRGSSVGRIISMGVLFIMLGCTSSFGFEFEKSNSFYDKYLADRLEVGLRFSNFSFKDADRTTTENGITYGYTVGISTYDMEEVQKYYPLPYVRYNFMEYVGLQLGWERLEGKTWTLDVNEPHSDGNLVLSGPSLMIYGRYPVGRFAPYAGIGAVFLSANFEQDVSWHADGLRNMEAEDTTGLLVTIGSSMTVYDHVLARLSFSSLSAESDARYWMRGDSRDRANWSFPCDSWLIQFGIEYAF